jgi:glucosamine-6-phosphate deaminase
MDIYAVAKDAFSQHTHIPITVVRDHAALNERIAAEFVALLREKSARDEMLVAVLPVGPLDYTFFADAVTREGLSCRNLITYNMDEYLDDHNELIPVDHPLSFRRYMEESFFGRLPEDARPLPENVRFPDPQAPERTTEFFESIGGADIVWGGLGLTGHFAFNDPPEPGEKFTIEDVRDSRTRCLTICRESMTQMAMGGTNGNVDIIPKRAVTLGMHELRMSKRVHMTFMRSWHAGVWRRAFFGPVTPQCPGSFLQEHANIEITMAEIAAEPPIVNVTQATGEEET